MFGSTPRSGRSPQGGTRTASRIALALAAIAAVLAVSSSQGASRPAAHAAPSSPTASVGLAPTTQPVIEPSTTVTGSTAKMAVPTPPAPKPGVPVGVIVPSHHLAANITAHPFDASGGVFVPADPKQVSWTAGEQRAKAPFDPAGTILFTSHVNYIINGQDVQGAFWDLANYRPGQVAAFKLKDGRVARYKVVRVYSIRKAWEAKHGAQFWGSLLDNSKSYGFPGGPHGARVVITSCGGNLIEVHTPSGTFGDYDSNVFAELWPIG
jgi:hypothetical protein